MPAAFAATGTHFVLTYALPTTGVPWPAGIVLALAPIAAGALVIRRLTGPGPGGLAVVTGVLGFFVLLDAAIGLGGRYDFTAGGVVAAGEDPYDAVVRELAEELGITGAELIRLPEGDYADDDTSYHAYLYSCVWDGPVKHQPEEVEWGAWMSPADLVAKEREFAVEQAKATGKPQQIAEKIAEGKMNAFFAERVLLDQEFFNASVFKGSVQNYLKQSGVELKQYVRIEVGQA